MDKNKILAALAVALLVGVGIGRFSKADKYQNGKHDACEQLFTTLQIPGECVIKGGETLISFRGMLYTLDGLPAEQ